MKRSLFTLFAVLMMTTGMWATVINGIDYTLNDGSLTATVSSASTNKTYSGSNLVIPKTVTYNAKTYTVTSIYTYAFQGNTHITSLSLPGNTMSGNGSYAFQNCTSLTQVVIEEGFSGSTLRWFNGCSALTTISIPSSMKLSTNYLFDGCSNLRDVYVHWTSLDGDEAESYTFNGLTLSNIRLHVPAGTESIYAARSPWSGFQIVPESRALKGLFSVSATKVVYFSKGNLQYKGSTNSWRFAAHQYDYIGNNAGNTAPSASQTEWMDLFGWATSGWNNGKRNAYQPYSTSTTVSDYGVTDPKAADETLTGDYANGDWGVYNSASIGSGWHTLTSGEWQYLIHSRTTSVTVNGTSHARYTEAKILTDGSGTDGLTYNICGVVLFPDDFDGSVSYSGVTWGTINAESNWATTCTTAGWNALEEAGCVFLPAAGSRSGTEVTSAGVYGVYWTATARTTEYVDDVYIGPSTCSAYGGNYRYLGRSVRLVCEPFQGSGTAEAPYLISSTADWDLLADIVNGGKNYTGVYFRQTADISVTTMVGTSSYNFSGIYDGYGHTLNVTLNVEERYVAPFHFVKDATIKNLAVTGSVNVSGSGDISNRRHAGGLVGLADVSCSIENCRVSVHISGTDYMGGIVGDCGYTTITLSGCVFDGTLTVSGNEKAGGLIGWGGGRAGVTVTIKDCLFAGTFTAPNQFHPIGCYNNPTLSTRILSNTYYTKSAQNITDDDSGCIVKGLSNKGKFAYSISGSSEVTVANAGEETNYTVSGITSYGTGIKYNNVLYGGSGDVISLSLSHGDKSGYTFNQYTVTGNGTLADPTANSTTLTMTAANQTIGATWKKLLTNGDISIIILSQPCTGIALTPVVTVKDGETGLTENTHYTVVLPEGRVNPGNYTVTINAVETSNYSGSTTATFTIYRNFAFTNSDWMTWYGAEDLEVDTDDMETYVVKGVTSTTITVESTEGKIYLNKPMLLKRVGSDPVDVRGYAPAEALTPPTGLSDAYIGGKETFNGYTLGTVYVLAGSEFIRARVTESTPFSPSKCFIYLTSGNANNSRLIIIGDGPTGINPVVTDGENDTWYTIGGRKLSKQPKQPGVYINNGKKVIVKYE